VQASPGTPHARSQRYVVGGRQPYNWDAMGDSALKRFWNAIKPPPAVPRRAWEPSPPSLWKRIWDTIKPPPPLVAVPAGVRRQRRNMLAVLGAVVLIAASIGGVAMYNRSAPERAQAALQDGMRLFAAGNATLAVENFTRAISTYPQSAQAYLQRGLARQSLGQTEDALQDFEQALRIDPQLAAAHTALGTISHDRGDPVRAAAEFTAALAVAPNEDAYYQRGQLYEVLGQHQRAIEDFTAAIALLPNAPYMYRARATAELAAGDEATSARDRARAYAIEHQVTGGAPQP
jgi:tetratricopeptide (TPR) repeat protein